MLYRPFPQAASFWTLITACLLLMTPYNSRADTTLSQLLAQHSAIMLLINPANGTIVDANQAAATFYGYPRDALKRMKIQQINQLSREQVIEEMALAQQEGRSFFVFRHQLASGDTRTVEVYSTPVRLQQQNLLFSIVWDRTTQRQATEALWHYQTRLEEQIEAKAQEIEQRHQHERYWLGAALLTFILLSVAMASLLRQNRHAILRAQQAEQRQREIIWGTNVGTWEWNVQTNETHFNERWAEIVGYQLYELEPISLQTWLDLCHEDDLPRSAELLEQTFQKQTEYYQCEARMRHKNGHWVWVLDRGKVVEWTRDGKPLRMSGTHQDITEQVEARLRIEHLANHDPLTDLPGLRLVKTQMPALFAHAKAQTHCVAILFIDLDGFKTINDHYGHDAGDCVLQTTAARLRKLCKENDMAARIGGDEFLVLLSNIHNEAQATQYAQQIYCALTAPISYQQQQLRVGSSIGIALAPKHGDTPDSLIHLADKAMYCAKRSPDDHYILAEQRSCA